VSQTEIQLPEPAAASDARQRQEAVADELSDYKFGWSDRDDQYSFTSKRGLTRETVAEISELKDEPAWMRDLRLRAY
jgi:Fe-S cluster assembly protein SufB